MVAHEGQLITDKIVVTPKTEAGIVVSDPSSDILKIVVMNRYTPSAPAIAFIKNLGFKRGAIASCVAHDSHNIVAVGADDASIAAAINLIVGARGGISLVDGDVHEILPLPVAGIMTGQDGFETARRYDHLDRMAKELGTSLAAPYMTLSFMALLVIPELKLSDKGLFDGSTFSFTNLFQE
jgi:adenine deaminase